MDKAANGFPFPTIDAVFLTCSGRSCRASTNLVFALTDAEVDLPILVLFVFLFLITLVYLDSILFFNVDCDQQGASNSHLQADTGGPRTAS